MALVPLNCPLIKMEPVLATLLIVTATCVHTPVGIGMLASITWAPGTSLVVIAKRATGVAPPVLGVRNIQLVVPVPKSKILSNPVELGLFQSTHASMVK